MKKHYKNAHNNINALAIAGHKALTEYRRNVDADTEAIRMDYQKQLEEKAKDDWLRNLAVSGQTFYQMTGDRKKTERFLLTLSEKLEKSKVEQITTAELCKELERATDIELEVQDGNTDI